ncbi:unnamed protein product, partial [Onchocerca ochengi]
TNPHCSSRNITTMANGTVLKPTLIDIDNNDGNEIQLVVPARSSDNDNCINNKNIKKKKNDEGIDDNQNDDNDDDNDSVKECSTKWCFTEQCS